MLQLPSFSFISRYYRRSSIAQRTIFLGIPMILAVLIGVILPMLINMNELNTHLHEAKNRAPSPDSIDNPNYRKSAVEKLVDFESNFPPENKIADQLDAIYKTLSESGINPSEAEYRVVDNSPMHIRSYQINMPIRGSYSMIIKSTMDVLVHVPNLSLNSISFKRKSIGETQSEATLVMTIYLKRI